MSQLIDRLVFAMTLDDVAQLDRDIEEVRANLTFLESLRRLHRRTLTPAESKEEAAPTETAAATPKKKSGRPKKVVATPEPVKVPDEFPNQMGAYLKENGPKRRDAIRNALECDNAWIDAMLAHPWFEKDGAMITLSSDGHVEFARHSGD